MELNQSIQQISQSIANSSLVVSYQMQKVSINCNETSKSSSLIYSIMQNIEKLMNSFHTIHQEVPSEKHSIQGFLANLTQHSNSEQSIHICKSILQLSKLYDYLKQQQVKIKQMKEMQRGMGQRNFFQQIDKSISQSNLILDYTSSRNSNTSNQDSKEQKLYFGMLYSIEKFFSNSESNIDNKEESRSSSIQSILLDLTDQSPSSLEIKNVIIQMSQLYDLKDQEAKVKQLKDNISKIRQQNQTLKMEIETMKVGKLNPNSKEEFFKQKYIEYKDKCKDLTVRLNNIQSIIKK